MELAMLMFDLKDVKTITTKAMNVMKKVIGMTALCATLGMGEMFSIEAQNIDTLSIRQQAIVPIAAFMAKGDLKHLPKALNEGLDAGLTVNEIKELLTHLYAYTGFPRSLNSMSSFMTVIEERKANGKQIIEGEKANSFPEDKNFYELGTEIQTRLSGHPVKGDIMDFAPAIDYCLKAHLFGYLFGRGNLDETSREIATLSALSALEGTEEQFKAHLRYATNAGLSLGQIQNIVTVLKNKVGTREAWRADKVLVTYSEHKYSLPEPIENIFPKGRISTADYFTGTVWNQRLVSSDSITKCQTSNVTFEAGSRTRWHIHTGTQILLCTAGIGWDQEQGQAARELQAGDVVVIRPGVVHWHGASASHEFSHLSVIPNPEKNKDTWLEAVNEEDYQLLK